MIDFNQTYILEDEWLKMKPLEISDYEYLLPYSENEPELWRYAPMGAAGAENLKKYLQKAIDERLEGKSYPFIVFDKRSEKYIGSTQLYDIQSLHQTASIGYTWYGRQFQGTGINKHCKYLLFQWAFETLGMQRIEFRANAENARSIQAMKNIGCVEEGVLRNNMVEASGKRRNSIVMSVLSNEWQGNVKSLLQNQIHQL